MCQSAQGAAAGLMMPERKRRGTDSGSGVHTHSWRADANADRMSSGDFNPVKITSSHSALSLGDWRLDDVRVGNWCSAKRLHLAFYRNRLVPVAFTHRRKSLFGYAFVATKPDGLVLSPYTLVVVEAYKKGNHHG